MSFCIRFKLSLSFISGRNGRNLGLRRHLNDGIPRGFWEGWVPYCGTRSRSGLCLVFAEGSEGTENAVGHYNKSTLRHTSQGPTTGMVGPDIDLPRSGRHTKTRC